MAVETKAHALGASHYDILAVCALVALFCVGPFLWLMDTMSLQYHNDDATRALWWITWSALLPIGVYCILKAGQRPSSIVMSVVIMSGVAVMFGLVMCFMWFRASYSFAYKAEIGAAEKVGVALSELPELDAKRDVALVALEAGQGFVQSMAVFQVTNFSYGCHGQITSSYCHTSVSSGGPRSTCQHLFFPDECPGAELLMITPVWYDNSSVTGRPYALAVQSKTFLFNNDSGRSAWAVNNLQPEFKSQLCRHGRFCAFMLSNSHVEPHWNEWHSRDSAAEVLQDGVGQHSHTTLPYERSAIDELARDQMQKLNMAGDYLPLLWVPADTPKSFLLWESNLHQSESDGRIGFILLLIFAAGFAFASCTCFAYAVKKNAEAVKDADPSV